MNVKKIVTRIKKCLEEKSKYGYVDICDVCPFSNKDCVEGITNELKKRKISDKPFRVNVEKPYSFFDCSRAYKVLYKSFFRNIKI